MTAHEVLVDARNYIAHNGWIQNTLRGSDGSVCAGGAIRFGGSSGAEGDNAAAELARVLPGPILPNCSCTPEWCHMVAWNNTPGRTKQEVLDAFDRAISATAPEPADPLEGVDVRGVVAS